MFVAIDPQATAEVDPELLAEIGAFLEPLSSHRPRSGCQKQAEVVGLDLGLHICVPPGYLRGHVKAAMIDVFSSRVLPDGTRGVPSGQSDVRPGHLVTRLVAAAQRVTGVQHVEVTRLTRFEIGEPRPGPGEARLPAHGVLALGAFEIARLDNDPNVPENGRLTLDLGGGR